MKVQLATELEIREDISRIRAALDQKFLRPNIWGFFSNKNSRVMTLLGDVTFIQAILLEADPRVACYDVGGPNWLGGRTNEESDLGRELHVQFLDGTSYWFLCGRYENLVKNPGKTLKQMIASRREAATAVRATYSIHTERDFSQSMTKFRNWLPLCAAMTRARDFSSEFEISRLFELLSTHHEITIEKALGLEGIDPALMLAGIAHGLANGQIKCDLEEHPICLSTTITGNRLVLKGKSAAVSIPAPTRVAEKFIPRNRRTDAVPELWRCLENWPTPIGEHVDACDIYASRKQAVDMYLYNRSFEDIRRLTGYCEGWVRKLVRKCLQGTSDGRIRGYRALPWYGRSEGGYRRVAPLPATNVFEARKSGYSGAFVQLLERFPEQLLALIESHVLKLRTDIAAARLAKLPEARISWKNLKGEVRRFLRSQGVGNNEYPFNTRDQGYTSLARLCRAILFRKPIQFIEARGGREAGRRGNSGQGKGIPSLIQATASFQICELDFHKFDSAATVSVETPHGNVIDAPVARWWIGAIVDVFNKAIIGSSDSFEFQTSESCVLDLLDSAMAPPMPVESLRKFSVAPDGLWLPNQLIPQFEFHGWDILRLDRAWAHKATGVLSSIVSTAGCAVCFSRPREWWCRATIERTFGEFTQRAAQRLPSTYGTGPQDTRRDDPDGNAIVLKIRQDEICDLAKATIRSMNLTEKGGAFFESPLANLERMARTNAHFPRPLPMARQSDPSRYTQLSAGPFVGPAGLMPHP